MFEANNKCKSLHHNQDCPGGGCGLHKIGFTDTDVENYYRDEKENKRGLDGQLLFQLFENRNEMDSGFTNTIERDAYKKITHVLWTN